MLGGRNNVYNFKRVKINYAKSKTGNKPLKIADLQHWYNKTLYALKI